MKIGDQIVTTKKVELVNGGTYPRGIRGVIVLMPPNKSVLHILFEGSGETCVVVRESIRLVKRKT